MNSHTSIRAGWARWFSLFIATFLLAGAFLPSVRLRADSNPNVALSVTFAQRPIGKVAVLAWLGAPGAAYKVQYRTTLSEPAAWVDFEVVVAQAPVTTSEVPLSLLGSSVPDEGFFRLVLPDPEITGIEPALLNVAGGQLYIVGQCFAPGDLVRINGVDVPANFINHTLLLAAVPSFAAGVYDVQVVRSGDVIASLVNALTITTALALETYEPPSLPPGAPIFRPPRVTPRPEVQGSQSAVVTGPPGEEISPDKYGRVKVQFHWDRKSKADVSASGELLESSVDLHVPGRGLDFIWATTYRSRNGDPLSTMGNNWSHSYDIRCAQNGVDMDVRDGTGRRDTFFLQPDGSFSKRGFFRRGTLAAGNVFTLEFADKGRWVFRPLDGSQAAGKIAQSIDRNGNAMQFNYDGAGRLAAIVDTLSRVYLVNYDGSGRLSAVTDFTGRAVTYTYYGAGNPLGPQGALRMIRSPLVTGTPTGNDFPTGKTTVFTYSTGFADPRLNNNLLTITDPKGQTSLRFTYAPTLNPADVEFDRVFSVQRGNQLDPIDKPSVLTWLEQTPSPANGYARLKLIANDPVGNVTTRLFESRNLLVTHIAHTGRSTPGVAVTEADNLPAGQLRPGDPQTFTTRLDWNPHYRPERITRPLGTARVYSWESDFNPGANPRELGNVRTVRKIGTGGEALVWRMHHEPGFGTAELGTLRYSMHGVCGDGFQFNIGIQDQFGDGDGDGMNNTASVSRLMEEEGIYYANDPYSEDLLRLIGYTVSDPDNLTGDPASGTGFVDGKPVRLYTVAGGGNDAWDNLDECTFSCKSAETGGLSFFDIAVNFDDLFCSAGPGGNFGGISFLHLPPLVDCPYGEERRAANYGVPYDFARAVTDPRGFTVTSTYDAAGNRTEVQLPVAGAVRTFTYNAFGQVASHLHPANGSGSQQLDTFTYYNAGPQNGYLAGTVADAGGLNLTTSFEWNPRGALVRTVDARGNDWLLARNQLDEIVRASSPLVNGARNERDFIYDANGNLVRLDIQNRDENGLLGANTHFSRTWSYDFRDCPTQRVDEIDAATTRATQFVYDGNRDLALVRLPEAVSGADPDNVVGIFVDERCLLFRVVRAPAAPLQSTTQFDYGLNGRLTAHRQGIESAPRVTLFGYDGLDRFVRRTDAGGNVRDFTLDGAGNATRFTITGNAQIGGAPVLLFAADYSYNGVNQLTQSRVSFFNSVGGLPFGDGFRTATLARAANQQVTAITDDNGHTTSYTHDTANRLVRVTDARGNRRDFTLDANGNTTAALWTDKRDSGAPDEQFRRTFDYDTLNRLERAQDNVANLTTYRYDSRGNLTRRTDPRGTDTLYQYDGLSRRVRSVEDMDGSSTETPADIARIFEYDNNSRRARMTDDNGNVTTRAYDSLNRPVASQFADGTQHGWTYDVHHNVVSSIDANGTAITFTHDLLNRLTQKNITPGAGVAATTTFEEFYHDGMSRLLRAVNDSSTVDFTYDSLSNVRTETTGGLTTSATFDAAGNRLSLTYPSGRVLTYSRDVLDRVTAITDGPLTIASYLYAGAGRIERTDFGNGTRLDVTYDGQLGAPIVPGDFGWRNPVLVSHTKIAGGAVIDDRAMTWDRNQNKLTRNQLTPFAGGGPAQSRAFNYDADDRLVQSLLSAGGPATATQYQLDGESNRVQVIGGLNPGAYTRDATAPVPADFQRNQYTTTPSDARQYDEIGNVRLTNPTGPNGLFRFMTFDYANRLVSAQTGGGFAVQYRYDALGRGIQRDVAPPGPPIVIITRFVHDGAREIEERGGGGAVLATFITEDNNPAVCPTRFQMRRGGQDYWLHADDTGNVMALTDAAGAVLERYDYDDYGRPRFLDASGAQLAITQSAAGNPFLYHSARWQPELRFFGLGALGGCFFDPDIGRMIDKAAAQEDAGVSFVFLPLIEFLKLVREFAEALAAGLGGASPKPEPPPPVRKDKDPPPPVPEPPPDREESIWEKADREGWVDRNIVDPGK